MPASKNDLAVDEHLAKLLGHGETLGDFASWFMNALWSIELNGSDREIELAARIQNHLFGYSSGYVPLDELMNDLRLDAAEFGVELRESSAA